MANKDKYTATQMIEAIRATKGMLTKTAEYLGCSYNTVKKYINEKPTVKEAYEEEYYALGDAVELALYDEAINNRDITALIFLAKTKFRDRGFVERREVAVEDWRSQAINGIRDGEIDYDALVESFDEDLATELFRTAGVPIPS